MLIDLVDRSVNVYMCWECVQKSGNWMPHQLKERYIERRLVTCEMLLQRFKKKAVDPFFIASDDSMQECIPFLESGLLLFSYKDIEKWLINESKEPDFFLRGIRLLPERWKKVVASTGAYFE